MLRIPINEWPLWTLREYINAYNAWRQVNVLEPWRRTRALSYYNLIAQGAKVKKWTEIFPIEGDKIDKRLSAVVSDPTKEEIEILKNVKN